MSRVERAFRCLEEVDLDVRPIRHWAAPRVRAHVFLCVLADHVEWHLWVALPPLLFDDTELAAVETERSPPAASTEPSEIARAKTATKCSADGQRVMSFAGLLAHLGTFTRNIIPATAHRTPVHAVHQTNPIAGTDFRLLNLEPIRVQ